MVILSENLLDHINETSGLNKMWYKKVKKCFQKVQDSVESHYDEYPEFLNNTPPRFKGSLTWSDYAKMAENKY